MALFSTVETSSASSLCWGCLAILIRCWGRKAGCLVVLPLILVTSLLAVLTILLLLWVLPLRLLLIRTLTLMLISLWVTRLSLRGDKGADSRGPRAEREGVGARAGRAAALTGGPARAERGGGEGARAGWADWAERSRGAGVWAFSFFFYSSNCFSLFFLFTLFDSILKMSQIQISTPKYYASNKSEI
jgi:hypothetical protein